ncbi:hypothetical protein NMY22_g14547 [Coprinellus aureogranulatus]|nr:hypothetical protein NMY22_g14547 [Coprinellus aureogranulatus]
MGVFVVGLIITGWGTGLFKANISPLVAEQYRRTKLFIKTTSSGERVIVDPGMTVSRLYMYFYLFINIGAIIGQISMTYAEKYVGFWLAFTLPTVVFLLCPIVLIAGRKRYVRTPPTGSVLATAIQLWSYAAKGKWSLNPVTTFRNMSSPSFWEDAKPSKQVNKPAWMNFDDKWVDEVQSGLKACSVFLWFPLYWLTYNQLNNNLTSQAATMSTHGLPNDILSNLDPLALLIFIPICDFFLYPMLRRAGVNFSPLKRITAGFITGALAMVWASVLQHYIYKTSPCGYFAAECDGVSPLNVWIQTGSYVLVALSEIFAAITGMEYAYSKAPKNMRSLVMSVYLFASAIASAIGEAFVPVSTDPLLIWNYGTMAVISAVSGVIFWFMFRKQDKQDSADALRGEKEQSIARLGMSWSPSWENGHWWDGYRAPEVRFAFVRIPPYSRCKGEGVQSRHWVRQVQQEMAARIRNCVVRTTSPLARAYLRPAAVVKRSWNLSGACAEALDMLATSEPNLQEQNSTGHTHRRLATAALECKALQELPGVPFPNGSRKKPKLR